MCPTVYALSIALNNHLEYSTSPSDYSSCKFGGIVFSFGLYQYGGSEDFKDLLGARMGAHSPSEGLGCSPHSYTEYDTSNYKNVHPPKNVSANPPMSVSGQNIQ